MLKLVLHNPGLLGLGLSFKNLDKFEAEPHDTYILVKKEETGLSLDVILYSGDCFRRSGSQNGRDVFLLGIDQEQIDMLRQSPGRSMIKLDKKDYKIDFDILIFSGENEAEMTDKMRDLIGSDTRVKIDPKLRN